MLQQGSKALAMRDGSKVTLGFTAKTPASSPFRAERGDEQIHSKTIPNGDDYQQGQHVGRIAISKGSGTSGGPSLLGGEQQLGV